MTVETLYGEFGYHVFAGHGLAGSMKCAFGRYNWGTVVVEDGDIRKLLRLPARCLVVGGFISGDDIDTGSETFDADLGWADNGGASETHVMRLEGASRNSPTNYTFTNMGAGSASATGLLNTGVWNGDIITDLVPAGFHYKPFLLATGPIYFSRETDIQFEVNAASATPEDAQAWAYVYYIMC